MKFWSTKNFVGGFLTSLKKPLATRSCVQRHWKCTDKFWCHLKGEKRRARRPSPRKRVETPSREIWIWGEKKKSYKIIKAGKKCVWVIWLAFIPFINLVTTLELCAAAELDLVDAIAKGHKAKVQEVAAVTVSYTMIPTWIRRTSLMVYVSQKQPGSFP